MRVTLVGVATLAAVTAIAVAPAAAHPRSRQLLAASPTAARSAPSRAESNGTDRRHKDRRSTAQLRRHGRFLTDPKGRVVILHGINLVYKHTPFVAKHTKRGFTAKDARFMSRHGIDAVRLGVLFQGVMPHPGHIDHDYLDRINRIVKLLAARHIWVLLDFHQDAFNQRFAGEGFPAWAVHDDGLPFADAGSFFVNDQTPAVEAAYDHFWDDDDNLWRHYDRAWRAVAHRWRHQPYLMGYDLFNEPTPGSQFSSCANPAGCPLFDATLQRMQTSALHAIRKVDRHNIVWFEPEFLFNAIAKSNFTHINDPEIGFSWHDYACTPAFVSGGVVPGNPDCVVNEPRVMDNAAAQAKTMGAASLLSEFGAEDDRADLQRMTTYADQHLDGWLEWAFKTWNDPTGSADEGLFRNDHRLSSVKRAKLRTLFHPEPRVIAGKPTDLSWDPAAKTLDFSYRPRGHRATRVEVPPGFYPHGYDVHVSGGRAHATSPHRISVRAAPRRRSVTVKVTPGR